MYNPMMIDEINQHTTAAVGGIDLSPVQAAVSDNLSELFINGYREKALYFGNFDTLGLKTLIDVQGEGYVDAFVIARGFGSPVVTIDGNVCGSRSSSLNISEAYPFGFTLKDYLLYTGTDSNGRSEWFLTYLSGGSRFVHFTGHASHLPIRGYMDGGFFDGEMKESAVFSIIPAPVKFKHSLKITFNTNTGVGGTNFSSFIHYWLKTS